jgi:hypothetical protein
VRTAVGTTVTYFALIMLLRVAGQRTLAKWYAFDLIVTVALGSTFVTCVLSNLGFAILVTLQFGVAWIIVRRGKFRLVVNPPPALPIGRADQRLSYALVGLTRQVRSLLAKEKTEAVLTHPYEGGHRDHDAIAIEMAFYHQGTHGICTGEFLPES